MHLERSSRRSWRICSVASRRPDASSCPANVGWARGTDADYLAELVEYWAAAYDWRTHEERILALPWVRTNAGGFGARAVHQRSEAAAAPALVLLHGWPDSVLRFERVLPLLSDLHVVVPCLPGFPFADPLTEPGMSTTAMAGPPSLG